MDFGDQKKRCPAMIEAGIKDPDSQEGIDFCVNECPYDKCIVFELGRSTSKLRRKLRAALAKEMQTQGYTAVEIASEVRVSVRTVQRYLEGGT